MISRRTFYCLFLVTFALLSNSCKQGDDGLGILAGEGGTTTVVGGDLEITSYIPGSNNIIIEINETKDFVITAISPYPAQLTYSWTLNGQPIGATNVVSLTGDVSNVGSYTLVAQASDNTTTKSRTWNIKINGPPVITPVTTGTPKVAYDGTLNINATASDPNSDSLTYTWLLNGATSSLLTGVSGTGTLTGDPTEVGNATITLNVSDGTRSSQYTWNVEINYFNQACNQLQTGQICTFAGGAHKGNQLAANNTQFPLRFRPFKFHQESNGNLFISDLDSMVVWYWNQTGAPVTRIGQTIPAGVIQVVAGTGEDATGAIGIPATQSPLNNPYGLWYDEVGDRLFIAEYDGHQVKFVNSSGVVFTGMGGSNSHVDGDSAYNHDCNRPVDLFGYAGSLYVTCYDHHRVKRWDLSTDLAYVVAGDGGADGAGENIAATSGGMRRPYGLFVDTNGIYVTLYDLDVVRFVNHSGGPINFWAGNPDALTVSNGNVATIMGDGGTGNTPATGNPLSSPIGLPTSVFVRNLNEIYVSGRQRHHLVLGNNSPAPITIDAQTIPNGQLGRFSSISGGYNGVNFGVNSTRFNQPYHLAINPINNSELLIADYTNYRVRAVDIASGSIANLLGSGSGKNGFTNDAEKPHFQHLLDYPTGITYEDSTNTLFIADQHNQTIRSVNPYGLLKTVVGNGDAAGDPIIDDDFPGGAPMRTTFNGNDTTITAFDLLPDGSLLQLNSDGHNLRLWNRTQTGNTYFNQYITSDRITTLAGNYASPGTSDGNGVSAQMDHPNSARFYDNGGNPEVFIADSNNHCIRKLDNTGNVTTVLGLCGTSGNPGFDVAEAAARFNRPKDIAIDSLGNLFISDFSNHHIWYWNRTAAPVNIGPTTINANRVKVIACISGTGGSPNENVLATSARCNQPVGLALYNNQLCYAQRNRHNVRCIDTTTGFVNTVAGRSENSPSGGSTFDFSQEGILATSATLLYPSGVTFDGNGDLYIGDTYNHVIRKVKLSP